MKLFLSQLLLCLVLSTTMFAQTAPVKYDVIQKTNGEEMKGKVMEMNDTEVKFTYAGETLLYTIKKSDIQKITFGSGRVEVINAPTSTPATDPTTPALPATPNVDPRNRVAILPFTVIHDGQDAPQDVSFQIQSEAYHFLNKHAGVYTLVDPRTVNVALNKAGITKATFMNYSMDEIANALGVEYVVIGTVSVNRTSATTYGSSTYNDKENKDKNKKSGSESTYATSTQNYSSKTEISIYNNKGQTISNQNRNSMLNTQDAYHSTLEYLLKRCPLYTK
ncbi:hypothetical protein LX64_04974 [Chitinophaga skermanii]|uniref:Uncharacterized protein n=1 Tax=Chitinophaga skermanii TaxID=331697 RepID=A0A327Q1S4_9BACT|nr:hypothetical protein [Chitinophaga skermanii]RAI97671.1 hypothetical protein LX64_04974 [Chitinophaga skermanii]